MKVTEQGTRSWIFRFMLNGRAREMGLGPIHTTSLAEAIEAATECHKFLKCGVDPIDARTAERKHTRAKTKTFAECAAGYRSPSPELGKREARVAVGEYAQHLCRSGVRETARQCGRHQPRARGSAADLVHKARDSRQGSRTILDWARVRGYRVGDNPARWKGPLEELLPKRGRVRKVRHHPALPYDQAGAFTGAPRTRESTTALALEFLILTATRSGEVLGARWSEIDEARKSWIIPAARRTTSFPVLRPTDRFRTWPSRC